MAWSEALENTKQQFSKLIIRFLGLSSPVSFRESFRYSLVSGKLPNNPLFIAAKFTHEGCTFKLHLFSMCCSSSQCKWTFDSELNTRNGRKAHFLHLLPVCLIDKTFRMTKELFAWLLTPFICMQTSYFSHNLDVNFKCRWLDQLMKKVVWVSKLTNLQTYFGNGVYFWFQFAFAGSPTDLTDLFICSRLFFLSLQNKKKEHRNNPSPVNWSPQLKRAENTNCCVWAILKYLMELAIANA